MVNKDFQSSSVSGWAWTNCQPAASWVKNFGWRGGGTKSCNCPTGSWKISDTKNMVRKVL